MSSPTPAGASVLARARVRLFEAPLVRGGLTLPPPGLLLLATIGGILLLNVAVFRWATPSDEHAYFLAARRLIEGVPLYDPAATPVTPYAYWYPPLLAQVLVPVALVLPALWFTWAWTLLMLACLWWLADRRLLVALALVAFPPVAVEFWFRNVHLVLALLLVLAVTKPAAASAGAAVKLSPGLAIPWFAARRRWREASVATAVGLIVLAVSLLLSPQAWADWLAIALSRGLGDVASFLPIPFFVRAVAGLILALAAARLPAPWAQVGLVVAVTLALPTLWFTALSLLVAVVPMYVRFGRPHDTV